MLNITAARKARRKPIDLNMAPLIDMVFILLIFFLVTTSFVKETGVEINRPAASTAVSKEKTNILVGIARDNRIFMDKREIDIRAVRAHVERSLAENPEAGVVIVADRESQTGIVIKVMDGCKLAGAKAVSIAASLPSE
ncbi:MAG: biopolymer transporter ExbD [Desulfobacterales bacterium]|nr:biopolymer transporter ExbD [Desulfobacterales bacterium]